jgi:hypothetical protein
LSILQHQMHPNAPDGMVYPNLGHVHGEAFFIVMR